MTDTTEPHKSSPFDEADNVPERALRIYARLWQLETWLRCMVYVELRALLGDNWSKSLPVTLNSLESDKYLSHMPTPEMNALSYSQLSKLIELVGKHWNCFEPYLPPQPLWEAKLKEISQIRHRIAHFRVGHVDDYVRLLQFLRDLDKGFFTFCTSYNDSRPVLPQSNDPVTAHFLSLDPLPWTEIEPRKWARVGSVNRSPVIGMTVEILKRPWAVSTNQIDGTPGYLHDIVLMTHYGRKLDYAKLLERSLSLHAHATHLCLSTTEESFRLTLPTVLGSAKAITLIEEIVEIAAYASGRSRNPIAPAPDVIAAEWPEYVLGPRDPLTFLSPEMKCAFFNA